jgi:predicted anti-sigma-YlaC factor YlaD
MWLTVYLCGWLFATICALAVAERVSGSERPSAHVSLGVGVVAGALWPVVIAGLVQMAAIALIARSCRAVPVRDSGLGQSIQLKEVLAFSSYS